MSELFKAVNRQTKEIVQGSWETVCDLDKRIWDVKKVDLAPASHRQADVLKAIEIIHKDGYSFAGRVALVGRAYRYHGFTHKVLVNLNLTPYNYRYMKESY